MTATQAANAWPATARFGLAAAPHGLALVQDLANTRLAAGGRAPDLLADAETATAWMSSISAELGTSVEGTQTVDPSELYRLVALREQVVNALAGGGFGAPQLLTLTVSGGVDNWLLEPVGSRVDRITTATLLAIRDAQLTGTWTRLKECANGTCPCVFYDLSRNNSRVWHAVRGCGNPANLRNSRRHRAALQSDGEPTARSDR